MADPKPGINMVPSVRAQSETKSIKENKTILIVGQTGSGKTTVINSMMNYLYNVQLTDEYRYHLIKEEFNRSQAESQTSQVTSYYIEPSKLTYGLTIIDTPGFGDTRGLKQDDIISAQVRDFFETEITGLNAVCLVINASVPRLTPSQQYVFQRLLGIFGKDIEDHILGLFTFCDGSKINALEAVQAANIPLQKYFRINNSAFGLKTSETKEDDDVVPMFWNLGMKAYEQFFQHLNTMAGVSTDKTREVLKQRQALQCKIESFQDYIKRGIQNLESLRQLIEKVKDLEGKIESNKDYYVTTQIQEEFREPITDGSYTTLCTICHNTCHYTCTISNDNEKIGCCAMSNGYCTVCPRRCHWEQHQNNTYRWSTRMKEEIKTLDELKKAYTSAKDKRSTVVQMVENMGKEFNQVQETVYILITEVHKCVTIIQQIALRPNVLSQAEYIELLIHSEEAEQKPGYMDRVAQYQKLLSDSKRLEEIMNGDYKPWNEHIDVISQLAQGTSIDTRRSGFFASFTTTVRKFF